MNNYPKLWVIYSFPCRFLHINLILNYKTHKTKQIPELFLKINKKTLNLFHL